MSSYLPPHGLRTFAWIIDFLIVNLVVMFALPQPVRFIVPLALFVSYHTILVWLLHRSPGKALLGLRVARAGKRPTLLWALGRASLRYFVADLLGLGLFIALFDSRRRCAHDYVFGSFVIFEGIEAISAPVRLFPDCPTLPAVTKAVEEKKKPVVALVFLFSSLSYVADKIAAIISYLAGTTPAGSAPPVGIVIGQRLAALILAASAAMSASTLAYSPSVRYYAGKILAPHYILRKPPADWVACECPQQQLWYGAYYGLTLYHPPDIHCS
jgi:uncharacterized RDD family membrane protein YckC